MMGGALNEKLEIYRKVRSVDEIGGGTVNPVKIGSVTGKVIDNPVGADIVAGRSRKLREVTCLVLDSVGISANDLILTQGSMWEIQSLARRGSFKEMVLRESEAA